MSKDNFGQQSGVFPAWRGDRRGDRAALCPTRGRSDAKIPGRQIRRGKGQATEAATTLANQAKEKYTTVAQQAKDTYVSVATTGKIQKSKRSRARRRSFSIEGSTRRTPRSTRPPTPRISAVNSVG